MRRALMIALWALLASCRSEADGADKPSSPAPAALSRTEAQLMAERAEAARERNSNVTRPPRRFTAETL